MLENMTLLDFSSMGPGPRCTRLLADYGLRVVKIRPPAAATRMMDAPWFAYSANRGIPQVHVDLKHQAGRQPTVSPPARARSGCACWARST
jgi:alpha-methylacyl-CoA racemase